MNAIRGIAWMLLLATMLHGEDWPQFRGVDRDAVWHEDGILQSFPEAGLKTPWQAEVGMGMSSPVIAHGRIHPAFLWGGVLLMLSLRVRFAVGRTDAWLAVAGWLTH